MKLVQGVIKAPFLHTKGADEETPSSSCSLALWFKSVHPSH